MDQHVLGWIGAFSYPAVALLIALTGVGLPVSEELVLLAAGVVVARGDASLLPMIAVAFAAVLVADNLLYRVGRRLGPRAVEHKHLKKLLTRKRVAWIESHFHRHGWWTILVARFLPGVRAPAFLVAGMGRMRLSRFLVADALGSAVTAPLLVWLGYRFGHAVLKDVKVVGKTMVAVVAVTLLSALLIRLVRARRLKSGEADAAAARLERDLEPPSDLSEQAP